MTDEEVAAAAAFINHDWVEHPELPADAPPAVPGDLHVKSTYSASGWVPY